MANEFNVLDMANEYAANNDIDTDDLFKPAHHDDTQNEVATTAVQSDDNKSQMMKLAESMPEFQGSGAVYDADEIKNASDQEALRNIADDEAADSASDQLNEMERTSYRIEMLKKRHNIQLQIPQGPWQVKFIDAASDPDTHKAMNNLEAVLEELKMEMPFAIIELGKPKNEETTTAAVPVEGVDDVTDEEKEAIEAATAQVVIDKRNVDQLVWSEEEIAKIKKSKQIELNIIETDNIEFNSISDADDNAVDQVLQQYVRNTNDVTAPLPASKYRATFTGLSYPEILGLQASFEINTIDAERKKWTIAFNHMTNISIGPWEKYTWYEDKDKNIVKLPYGSPVPTGFKRHDVSEFEDFMRKTSFLDLNYILWKIVCATTTPNEIVSVTCGVVNPNTKQRCKHTYDWIYDPASLLDPEDVNPTVIEEADAVGAAGSIEEARRLYNEGPVCGKNIVKLHDSGWSVVYGHASAWDYVEGGIYDAMNEIYKKTQDKENEDSIDSDDIENSIMYSLLNCIKAILIPDGNGKYVRISGAKNLVKAIRVMSAVDFQTLATIMNLMISGYNYKFRIKNAVCPKCHGSSTIPIDDMSNLLFMIARSLGSTIVTLTKQS